jgi:hypothetical protein
MLTGLYYFILKAPRPLRDIFRAENAEPCIKEGSMIIFHLNPNIATGLRLNILFCFEGSASSA